MTVPGLLDWLTDPPPDVGVSFALNRDEWEFWSYRRLAAAAERAAAELTAAGVRPGDTVLLVYPNGPSFMAAFYGALVVGAVPAPVAPPTVLADRARYTALVRVIAGASASAATATDQESSAALAELDLPGSLLTITVDDQAFDSVPGRIAIPEQQIALLQFSSGSTGSPKGVQLTFDAVRANIEAIVAWLGLRADDVGVSWLPTHHDMGLIGFMLTPTTIRMSMRIMRPDQFVRSPARWLRTIGEARATIAGGPNFGLDHVARRVRPATVADVDLSCLRSLVVGAERVRPSTISAFIAIAGPLGFDERALLPAYGLAEASLAVTGSRPGEPISTVDPVIESLVFGEPVTFGPGGGSGELIGCGAPLVGTEVSIVDADGHELPPGSLGEVMIRSTSLARSIISADGAQELPVGVPLLTGDAGFLSDGELFVLGRLGDGVKMLGQWLFAEELEGVAQGCSPRPRQTVVLLGEMAGEPTAVAVLENGAPEALSVIGRALLATAPGVRVLACSTPVGWIQRTTSGKVRRRPMWRALSTELEPGFAVWDSRRPATESAATVGT